MPEHEQYVPTEFVKLPPLTPEQGERLPSNPGLRVEWRNPETDEVVAPRFDCDLEEVRAVADVMDIPEAEIENTCLEFVDAESLDEFAGAHYDASGKIVQDDQGNEVFYRHVIRIAGRAAEDVPAMEAEDHYNTAIVHELEHLKQKVEGRMEKGSVSERRAIRVGRAAMLGTLASPAAAAWTLPKMIAENFVFNMLDRITGLPTERVGTLLAIGVAGVGAILGHRRVGEMAHHGARSLFHKIDKFENEARAAEKKYGNLFRAVDISPLDRD